jgi:formylglycine-generating enzyme required for sulfatase activity
MTEKHLSIACAIACAVISPFLPAGGAAAEARPPGISSLASDVVEIPAGSFIAGSDPAERESAYRLDEAAYGHSITRAQRWYDGERPRSAIETGRFAIMRTPVTNAQYLAFVAATGHRPPGVDAEAWHAHGLVHPYGATRRFAWRDGRPPPGREHHPVVLVSHADAEAFAAWVSEATGETWRLPTDLEWEKAVRGVDGARYPWGDIFDPARLNSHDAGPYDTLPVGSFPRGASPFGVLDGAGQVFEWTAVPAGRDRFLVKGGSWDDRGCGVCRPAAAHARPSVLRHILIGFRLVRD